MIFATTHFMPRSCVKISDTVVFGIPRSASSSYIVSHWPLLIVACTHSTFSGVPFVAGLLEHDHFQQILDKLWSICATLLFVLYSLHHPWKPFGIIQIVSMEECSSLTQNLMQIHSAFTQSFWMGQPHSTHGHSTHLLPPLTSTVKWWLFTHVHSSPLS